MTTKRSFSAEEAKQRFESLPRDIKDAIYSTEMEQVLTSIGDAHHLHLDQLSILESETSAMMLGFTEPQDFQGIIEERLHIESAVAKEITDELNAKLFEKIRESMKNMVQKNPSVSSETKPEVATPQVKEEKAEMVIKPVPTEMPSAPAQALSQPTISAPTNIEVTLPNTPAPIRRDIDPYREPIE